MLKRFLAACYQNKMFIFLILLGTLTWSLIMIKSGLIYPFGMGFWGPNGHDGIWHISLINSLARGNIEMPVFSGEQLKNYHIGFDLLLALIHKFTGISTVTLYFQLFPPILAFFIGILTYKFVIDWRKSKSEALWSVFFVYFGVVVWGLQFSSPPPLLLYNKKNPAFCYVSNFYFIRFNFVA